MKTSTKLGGTAAEASGQVRECPVAVPYCDQCLFRFERYRDKQDFDIELYGV